MRLKKTVLLPVHQLSTSQVAPSEVKFFFLKKKNQIPVPFGSPGFRVEWPGQFPPVPKYEFRGCLRIKVINYKGRGYA